MPRDGIECDESRWPIVVFRTIGVPTDAHVDRFIARADACLERREPYVVIFDNSHSSRATPYMRKRATEWLRRRSPDLSDTCLGTGLVFKSAALRFVMSTVMLVVSHPVPHEVCGTMEQAYAWARERLQAPRSQVS